MRIKRALILLAVIVTLFNSLFAWGESDVVSVFSINGDVKVVPKGRNVGVKCEKEMILHAGDWIKTGANSSVTIAFDRDANNVITIEEKSLIVIRMDGYFKVQLLRGEIYAILENVSKGETFRVLTPSVVTESLNSGWGAASDGSYTNVVVFDNRVFVCGINPEGEIEKKKYWIEEGYKRKTLIFEDPGDIESLPENAVPWFKEQVMAHHLAKVEQKEECASADILNLETEHAEEDASTSKKDHTDFLEYLYKQRLRYKPKTISR
ncbi:MAG: FecR family protein [Candidatus Omnitrophica bacterium]|nr:FecR family protein [Candidatus Omnitrophota bacterium]